MRVVATAAIRSGGQSAELSDVFEKILSVDEVKRYEPARENYEGARELSVATDDILLVAAHAWDLAGAMAAGCRAAFVERPPGSRSTRWGKSLTSS